MKLGLYKVNNSPGYDRTTFYNYYDNPRKIEEMLQPLLDKDEAAIINLEDVASIDEFAEDEEFRKEWISHSQYGFSICMNSGFKRVARMIAAHHARTDWGAIIDLNEKDLEPILYLVHHIDDLSAKFGKTSVAMLG